MTDIRSSTSAKPRSSDIGEYETSLGAVSIFAGSICTRAASGGSRAGSCGSVASASRSCDMEGMTQGRPPGLEVCELVKARWPGRKWARGEVGTIAGRTCSPRVLWRQRICHAWTPPLGLLHISRGIVARKNAAVDRPHRRQLAGRARSVVPQDRG